MRHYTITNYGTLKMTVIPDGIFADDDGEGYTVYLSRGMHDIFYAHYTGEGARDCLIYNPEGVIKFDPLTRAKAYRYWEKYFPNAHYAWQLPEIIQQALDFPPRACGEYRDKRGRVWYYEG